MKAGALWLSRQKTTDSKIADVTAEGGRPEAVRLISEVQAIEPMGDKGRGY
jgi:hypothetical protein